LKLTGAGAGAGWNRGREWDESRGGIGDKSSVESEGGVMEVGVGAGDGMGAGAGTGRGGVSNHKDMLQ
jgi:hypothetical protein